MPGSDQLDPMVRTLPSHSMPDPYPSPVAWPCLPTHLSAAAQHGTTARRRARLPPALLHQRVGYTRQASRLHAIEMALQSPTKSVLTVDGATTTNPWLLALSSQPQAVGHGCHGHHPLLRKLAPLLPLVMELLASHSLRFSSDNRCPDP
jgi:hypothetical protein